MANTFSWEILALQCYPTVDNYQDVVFSIRWSRIGSDGVLSSTLSGSQELTLNPSEPFVPYEELTEVIVGNWLESAVGAEGIAAIDNQLGELLVKQANSSVVNPPLPW